LIEPTAGVERRCADRRVRRSLDSMCDTRRVRLLHGKAECG
jgi:hypothetical protein